VGPRVVLDVVAKIKIPSSCRESNPGFQARSIFTILTELFLARKLAPSASSTKRVASHLFSAKSVMDYRG
jgi:hypothetical protein